jgi:surfeit locus 1 family protein
VLPFYVDADATPNPGGLPLGGQTLLDLPNDHLQYAITWYALAAALAVIYILFVHRNSAASRLT